MTIMYLTLCTFLGERGGGVCKPLDICLTSQKMFTSPKTFNPLSFQDNKQSIYFSIYLSIYVYGLEHIMWFPFVCKERLQHSKPERPAQIKLYFQCIYARGCVGSGNLESINQSTDLFLPPSPNTKLCHHLQKI